MNNSAFDCDFCEKTPCACTHCPDCNTEYEADDEKKEFCACNYCPDCDHEYERCKCPPMKDCGRKCYGCKDCSEYPGDYSDYSGSSDCAEDVDSGHEADAPPVVEEVFPTVKSVNTANMLDTGSMAGHPDNANCRLYR